MLFADNQLTRVIELTGNIWIATRARLETRLRPLSMTWPQFGMLLALLQADGITQRELGELLECDRTTVSVICDSLERHGWAERSPDPADRRANRVHITEAGREISDRAQEIVWSVYDSISDVLTPKEIEAVVSKLERVHEALKSIPKENVPTAPVAGADAE